MKVVQLYHNAERLSSVSGLHLGCTADRWMMDLLPRPQRVPSKVVPHEVCHLVEALAEAALSLVAKPPHSAALGRSEGRRSGTDGRTGLGAKV